MNDEVKKEIQRLEERLQQNPLDCEALNEYVDLALSLDDLQMAVKKLKEFARHIGIEDEVAKYF